MARSSELPDGVLTFEVSSGRDERGSGVAVVKPGYARGHTFTAEQTTIVTSNQMVLRGVHLAGGAGNRKLISCLEGEIFEVVVDLRGSSPTYGMWYGLTLSDECGRGLFLPPGVAHGFLTVSESSMVSISVDQVIPEFGINAFDPELAIEWTGMSNAHDVIRSERDASAGSLSSLALDSDI